MAYKLFGAEGTQMQAESLDIGLNNLSMDKQRVLGMKMEKKRGMRK